jgi:hypothetical protein
VKGAGVQSGAFGGRACSDYGCRSGGGLREGSSPVDTFLFLFLLLYS